MTKERNLLTGSVAKKLIAFALPLLLVNVLQSLYNVTDMLVVGRIVGESGISAIGNASKLCYVINSVCIGMTMGGAVMIARYQGENDPKGQSTIVRMLALLSLFSAALVTGISLLLYEPLFRVLEVPADAYQSACDYMRIMCFGTVFVFCYNAVCSILKGLGDSRSPLIFISIAVVCNAILDLIFVGPMGLGTKGAAYATVASQALSFIVAFSYLVWKKPFPPAEKGKRFRVEWDKIAAIVKIGLPTALQMVVVNTSTLIVEGMLNRFGTSVSAASNVGLQINTFCGMHCLAIGQAVTATVGQCMGAGDVPRARKVVRVGVFMSVGISLLLASAVQVFAGPLMRLFGDTPDVVEAGIRYLRICCGANALVYAAMYALDSFAIGIGEAGVALINALLDGVIVRLPVSLILAFAMNMGYAGIYWGEAVSPLAPFIVALIHFVSHKWEKEASKRKDAEAEIPPETEENAPPSPLNP